MTLNIDNLRSRIDQEFTGECHLSADEARELFDTVEQLRAALTEALDIADQHIFVPDPNPQQVQWSRTITIDSGAPYRAKARVAELRKFPVEGKMQQQELEATGDPLKKPGSGAGLGCHHCNDLLRRDPCPEKLELFQTVTVRPSDEDDYYGIMPALDEAAVFLGWRTYQGVWWCPTHVVAKNLACARCLSACPTCSCMGGPFANAVEGIAIDYEERP